MSLTKLSAKAAPTATLPPAAAASALATVEPLCSAFASRDLTVNSPPLPMDARVSLDTMFSATDGLTDISPAAPVVTLVSLLLFDCASKVRLPALISVTLSPMEASATLVILSRAKATPTPTFASAASGLAGTTALAIVLDLVLLIAIIDTSPVPASILALLAMAAVDEFVPTRLRATAPAMPTLVAPAPAVASALKLLKPSPPRAGSAIFADRSMPLALTVAAPMEALFSVLTIFSASPTPTPSLAGSALGLLPTAAPLAMAAASVSLAAASLNCPVALMTSPSLKEALALELTKFNAKPAAIETLPELVFAFPATPSLLALLFLLSSTSSCLLTCPSALSSLPPSLEGVAPEAEALAVALLLA